MVHQLGMLPVMRKDQHLALNLPLLQCPPNFLGEKQPLLLVQPFRELVHRGKNTTKPHLMRVQF